MHTGFLWGNLRERDHLGDLGVDGRIPYSCEAFVPQNDGKFLLVDKSS